MNARAEIKQDQIEKILADALAELYARNLDIIRLDVAERTICAQLVAILQRLCGDYAVHAEYNRHGVQPKEIELPNDQGVLTWNRVNPDIIIHKPGHDQDNVLVIEVKKSTNPIPEEADLQKLGQIKRQIAYRYALFLRLPTGPNADVKAVRLVWV